MIGESLAAHEIVLYADKGDMDDISYVLERKADSFVLRGPIKTAADLLNPPSLIIINRITGEYLILNGYTPESGICVKAQPRF
jgi:hypothetical protein